MSWGGGGVYFGASRRKSDEKDCVVSGVGRGGGVGDDCGVGMVQDRAERGAGRAGAPGGGTGCAGRTRGVGEGVSGKACAGGRGAFIMN